MFPASKSLYKIFQLFSVCRQNGFSYSASFSYILGKILNKVFKLDYIKHILDSSEFNIPSEIMNANIGQTACNMLANEDRKKFVWFVPNCANVWGGGHYTIFRFANYFKNQYAVDNIIYIYDYNPILHAPVELFIHQLNKALPDFKLIVETNLENTPYYDVAIATTWRSAYHVKAFARCKQKFYFMQDYESLFYPAGTLAMQANFTYSFGFHGITGGLWLKQIYESYGGEATSYTFSTDKDIFYPSKKNKIINKKIKKIFFYGRPSTPRRAYELGIAALLLISKKFPEIEIVIAGLNDLKLPFKCTLLGNLSLKKTGELYRTCDVGIALSATNLSYLPVELMASGCPVITNSGPQVAWYCKDKYNCLVADPVPLSILNCFEMLVNSIELRAKLITNGLKTADQTSWEDEMKKVYQYIATKIVA